MNNLDIIAQKINLDVKTSHKIRELLEDFEIIAGHTEYMLLISKHRASDKLIQNLSAAIVATNLRLQSIDYAKRMYGNTKIKTRKNNNIGITEYINAYKSAKKHVGKEISRLNTKNKASPPYGVFGASIALERLTSSFFSAHLLYQLGNSYEAHSISRLILEQIAWAYTAYSLENLNDIEKIITTSTISNLKKISPESGILYGFLSKKTHIDYDNHAEFLEIEEERTMILLSKSDYYEYAKVVLALADLFGIVWEISQFNYMSKTESVKKEGDVFVLKRDRPFLKVIEKHLAKLEKIKNM